MTRGVNGGPRATVFPSPPDQDEILVREIAVRLRELGIKAWQPSFPFLLHHRHYRYLGKRRGGKNYRRDQIGTELRRWAASRSDSTDYVWQAVCGALAEMENLPEDFKERLPDDIRRRLENLRWGDEFSEWLSSSLVDQAFARTEVSIASSKSESTTSASD